MKKLLVLLLSLITLFTLFGCSEFKEVTELKLSKKGVILDDLSEYSAWKEDYFDYYDAFSKSGELRDDGWYSVDYESSSITEDEKTDEYTKTYKTITGSYYYSPFDFEIKANLKFESHEERAYLDTDDVLRVGTITIESKIIYVKGVVYNKTKTIEESDFGKTTVTTYTKKLPTDARFNNAYSALNNFFSNTAFMNILPSEAPNTSLYSVTEIAYHNKNKIEFVSTKTDENEVVLKVQKVAEFEKNSHILKKYKFYQTQLNNNLTIKYEIKPKLSGSANRPSDYYKYEG